jgi:hypothetical protein
MQSPAMPRDTPTPTALEAAPEWLAPRLLSRLADGIAADLARGVPHQVAVQTATERARAQRPAMPMPHIAEAVALAVWIASAGMPGCGLCERP